jgi:histone H3/H4
MSAFDVRKPEHRMYITPDGMAVTRLLLAQFRDIALEGIVDGYVLGDELVLLLGDFSIRSIPVSRIPELRRMRGGEIENFELDHDGSFLYWPEHDLHLGVSQLLQAVDPSYLADIEIRRLPGSTAVGAAITRMREERGLRQGDIPGLSERQVRRIEKAISRLSGDAANRFAAAFQMEVVHFLEQVARAAVSADRSQVSEEDEEESSRSADSLIPV